MPTFDIVSEIENSNLQNAVNNANRDIGNRFDFRGVEAEVSLKSKDEIEIKSESDFQCKQILDILRSNLKKQSVDGAAVEDEEKATHRGKLFYLKCIIKTGIDKELAKKIIKMIKDSKLKLQCSIHDDEVRVKGKKIDELQEAIAILKNSTIKQPLQFKNFRD